MQTKDTVWYANQRHCVVRRPKTHHTQQQITIESNCSCESVLLSGLVLFSSSVVFNGYVFLLVDNFVTRVLLGTFQLYQVFLVTIDATGYYRSLNIPTFWYIWVVLVVIFFLLIPFATILVSFYTFFVLLFITFGIFCFFGGTFGTLYAIVLQPTNAYYRLQKVIKICYRLPQVTTFIYR